MRFLAYLLIFSVLISTCYASIYDHHRHHNRKRIFPRHRYRPYNQMKPLHTRSERNAEECEKHEHHLICGPEKHCDKTCDNLFSPPHCQDVIHHVKCYFPRCVCNDGFVRNSVGTCIKQSHCPNMYYEPASILHAGSSNEMTIEFRPVKFSRINHRIHRVSRKSKHRPVFINNKI